MFLSRSAIFILSLLSILLIYFKEADHKDRKLQAHTLQIEKYYHCHLTKILDGDTIDADCNNQSIRIRLLGIDAPEMGQIPWGEASKDTLNDLLPNAFQFYYSADDIYGRQLGQLYAQSHKDLNLQMIEKGAAVAYHAKDTPKNYFDAETIAKKNKYGIWSVQGHQQDPKNWRRHHL